MQLRSLPLAVALLASCGDDGPTRPAPGASRLQRVQPTAAPATLSVSGSVIDRDTLEPVADVEVVLRGDHGDITSRSGADGVFELAVARGTYRAFVRDARVMTVGLQGRTRLRREPVAKLAGAPDEMLMPVIEISGDTSGLELPVTVGAMINGVVTDPDGEPLGDVVIHAVALESALSITRPAVGPPIARRAAPRPVLGTDTVISDASGRFVLRVPAGRYELVASHPDYAGVGGIAEFELDAGGRIEPTLTLDKGCIISGRVVGVADALPHDGAIETHLAFGGDFGPSGRVNSDGTFRWTTTEEADLVLRAWPWKSAPSPGKSFSCRDGKRFTDVVLRVGNAKPDIAGTIVDASGEPVPLAFIDIQPIDFATGGQQERADARGEWHVYHMPGGRSQVTAAAPGRGIVTQMVFGPKEDLRLQLSGTGRIAGTTTEIVEGSFELTFHHCGPRDGSIELEEDARLVVVRGGRFSIDRVPACALTFSARWRDRTIARSVVVEPERTAYVELDLGGGREKSIHGTVRDTEGNPVANARVTALVDNQEAQSVRTDGDGHFTMQTQSGAQLVAGNGKRVGRATVGRANVPSEQVDVTLDADDY